MIEHHLQKQIIADLVECETARYTDLKPKHIEGNIFTYHLQSLLKEKFIQKTSDGKYQLTNKGKLYGVNSSLKKQDLLNQAHSIILLSIQDSDKWLLRRRLVQPMYGKIGFIHGEPVAGETVLESAARILHRRTELSGNFSTRGSGYVCLKNNDDLIAYSHFTLIEVSDLNGQLREGDSHGENVWITNPNFSDADMIPSMQDLVNATNASSLFFLDLSYSVTSD